MEFYKVLNYKIICILLLFFSLTSCSTAEYKEAILSYEEAQKTHILPHLVLALRKLAQIKPQKYDKKLAVAEKAQSQLRQAQMYYTQNDIYSAYLLSHDSYRNLPSIENKELLIESGKKLFTLLRVEMSIEDSYQNRPLLLTEFFNNYRDLDVEKWNLVDVNSLIEQLTKSIIELNSALDILKSTDSYLLLPEISQWENGIEEQLRIVTQARDYLPNIARYRSANILLELNNALSVESIELLSLVRSNMAKEAVQPSFIKAQQTYHPYFRLMENISLATNLSKRDIHVSWYEEWRNIEKGVLHPQGIFSNYPVQADNRSKQLKRIIEKNTPSPIFIGDGFTKKFDFSRHYPTINALIEKLKRDKSLLL